MPRSVDQIKHISLSVELIFHLDGVAFDCYAALPFKIHIVEHLRLHVFGSHCIRALQKTVGKC